VRVCLRAGFDASYMDPLGHMMLGSEDYRYFMQVMQVRIDDGCAAAAGQSCQDVAETAARVCCVCC
jgi:acetoin utilization deacetylase AcuC-like enzyme